MSLEEQLSDLPDSPGVYLYRDEQGNLLYVGKALSLRKRVKSYFRNSNQLTPRTQQMVKRISSLEIKRTTSETEALILEANLIKTLRPKYNVVFRDDKSYPMLKIMNEPFPRLRTTRRRRKDGAKYYGPFPEAGLMHAAVDFMRKVFPLRTCKTFPKTPCLEYHLGQCLAPCVGFIDKEGYNHIVKDLESFLEGKRDRLLKDLNKRMASASKKRRYEEAARLRDQIQALTSVVVAQEKSIQTGPMDQLQAVLKMADKPRRIEGFDISTILGSFSVGSMVVFKEGKPYKKDYRRFKIKTVPGIDDYAMMREVVGRRYSGTLAEKLPKPDLILIDGGKGQLAAAQEALAEIGQSYPILGLAKKFEHIFVPGAKDPIILLPSSPVLQMLQHLRDEAHRFAITYHRNLRGRTMESSLLHQIPGIGPKRAQLLLKRFGSLTQIAAADEEALADAAGMSVALAQQVLLVLKQKST